MLRGRDMTYHLHTLVMSWGEGPAGVDHYTSIA